MRGGLRGSRDGGPASYTVGNHGFTYTGNGIDIWNGKTTEVVQAAVAQTYSPPNTRDLLRVHANSAGLRQWLNHTRQDSRQHRVRKVT